MVLASSASEEESDHDIERPGIADIATATTRIDDVRTSKPAPDIFAVALKKVGVGSDEAIAVDDTPYDVSSAAKVGIRTVARLSGGLARSEFESAGGIAIYSYAADLLSAYVTSPLAR